MATFSRCVQCGEQLTEENLGDLGHGGSVWLECPSGCKDIFGLGKRSD